MAEKSPIVTTERLVLREFSMEDLNALAPILADEEVMRFSISGPMSREKTETMLFTRILGHYAKHGFGLWAAVLKEGGELIGFVGLAMQTIDKEEIPELGYRLSPKYWKKGLGTEAAKAVCQYAFEKLGLKTIISIIDPKNTRSLKVAERVGMHYWKDFIFHGTPVHIYTLNKPKK